jgi:hypothetical protein
MQITLTLLLRRCALDWSVGLTFFDASHSWKLSQRGQMELKYDNIYSTRSNRENDAKIDHYRIACISAGLQALLVLPATVCTSPILMHRRFPQNLWSSQVSPMALCELETTVFVGPTAWGRLKNTARIFLWVCVVSSSPLNVAKWQTSLHFYLTTSKMESER